MQTFLRLLTAVISGTHAHLLKHAAKAFPATQPNSSVPSMQLSLAVQRMNWAVVAGERLANDTETELRRCAMDLSEARDGLKAAVQAVEDSKARIDSERGQLKDAQGKHHKQKVVVDRIWERIKAQDAEAQRLQAIIESFNAKMIAGKNEVMKAKESLKCRAKELEAAKKVQAAKEKDLKITKQALERLRGWPDIDQWRLAQQESELKKKTQELKQDGVLLAQKEKAFEAELARIRDQAACWENDRKLLEQVSGHLEALEDVLDEKTEDLEDSAAELEDLRQLMEAEENDLKTAQADYKKNEVKLGDSVKTLMHTQDEQIDALSRSSSEKDAVSKELRGVIKGKTLKIEEQNGNLRKLTGKLHATNANLDKTKLKKKYEEEKRNTIIEKQEDVIAQQGKTIDAAEEEIKEKDEYVDHLNNMVSNHIGTIDGMKQAVAAHEKVVENMKEAYSNTKTKLDKCLVRDWSKDFAREHDKLADHVEKTIDYQHEQLANDMGYHVSKEVHGAVNHLDNRMVEESDHVVQEVEKQQSAHHDVTQGVTVTEAENTVDTLSDTMESHHAAVHQTVTNTGQGLADYVGHLSQQVADLKKMIPVQRDPIIDQMKALETSLNDIQSQMTTTTKNPIQQELQALSDGLNGVRDAMLKGAPVTTTTVAPPPPPPAALPNPDDITEHLSSLKKSLEVAGATQHMQALKNALSSSNVHLAAQAAPVQTPGQSVPVQVPTQSVPPVQPPSQAAPVQPATQPVPVQPAAVAVPEPLDPVTQHLMAIKNLGPAPPHQPVAQATAVSAPQVPAAPVAAKKITPAQFHEHLRALTDLLPPGAR
jgi:chromosome segregation ATPase